MLLRALAYEKNENVKNISKVVSFWVQTFVKHDNFKGIFKRRNSFATCCEFCFKNAVWDTKVNRALYWVWRSFMRNLTSSQRTE